MISELVFLMTYLFLIPMTFLSPFAGALAYEWLQYMPPYAVYNAGEFGSLSAIIGGLALLLWVLKDKKAMPSSSFLLLIFVTYIVWCNVTEVTSILGGLGEGLWERAFKTLLFALALAFMARTRARIEAYFWVMCLAIGNFVLSGAVKTILSGGGGTTVVGGQQTFIEDRVSFAIAVTTIIPFARYLRNHATLVPQSRLLKQGIDGFTIACVLAIVGSQARTGIVSLGILAVFYFIRARNKLAYLFGAGVMVGLVFAVAPPEFFERANTIQSYDSDASAMGRIASWEWGWEFTKAHPITGGGYHSYILHRYPLPDSPTYLEAHNILFETMADHGFVGLALFVILMMGTYLNCQGIRRKIRKRPEYEWAADLATMLQLALAAFLTGSMFLSSATHPFPYEICAMSLALGGIVRRQLASEQKPLAAVLAASRDRQIVTRPQPAFVRAGQA